MKKFLVTLAVAAFAATMPALADLATVEKTNTVDGVDFIAKWTYDLSPANTIPRTATLLHAENIVGEVTLPNLLSDGTNVWNVTTIADGALASNLGLLKVTVPNSILEIGAYAFSNCMALSEVTLNYGIRYIGERAFFNTAVRVIKVPDSLLDMGGNIAAGTLFTSSINIDDSSHFQYSSDGVLYNRDMTKLYSCPARAEGTVTIPGTVTNIAVDAFFGCNRISYLNLPATVNTIGTGAFNVAGIWPGLPAPESTPKLKSIFFNGPPPPNAADDIYSGAPADLVNYALNSAWDGTPTWKGRTVISIDGANPPVLSFTDVNNITWFYRIVNNEVEIYNEDAGGNPTTAVSPASTSGIDYRENEDSLIFRKALKIPDSINGFAVTKIGAHAFDGCAALSCLGIPASIREIGDYAFKGCTAITSIAAADAVPFNVEANTITLPTGVTALGLRPFEGLKVSSVSLPYTLTTVKGNPVAGCAFVTLLTVDATCPSFVSDGNILYNKRKDTVVAVPANYNSASVSFPPSVTTIGDEALIGCGNVTQVAIPDSLTAISNRAFSGCTALKSLSFPASLATIGTAAFADCTSLVKITYAGDAPIAADDIYTNTPATMSSYVSESATGFPDEAWKGRPLVRVNEGSQGDDDDTELRQTIGDVTWYFRIVDGYAEIWRDGATAVESASPILTLNLPSALGGYIVKGIGEGALSSLGGITSITIPNTYERIGDGALTNCTVLASVEMSHGLRSIGRHPFEGTAIETIALPDTVSSIDGNIFYGCNPSVSLSVGDNNPYFAESAEGALYSRDFSTLFACPMMTESITIPAATINIASEAFAGCMLLKSVYFEGDAPEAADGDDLYVDCHDSLTSFVQYDIVSFGTVPGTWHLRPVLHYGEEPPEEGELLTSADGKWRYRLFDDGTAEIWNNGHCAYLGESPVGSLQVPSTLDGHVVSAIGDGALANFAAVTSVSIPFSVTAIGEDVFTNCTLLAGFSVDSSNLRFSTDGSTLFDYQKTEIIAVGRNLESFTAPATVGKIRAHAFDGCSLLVSATFGAAIDEIGDGAFRGCTSLKTVIFGGDAPTTAADDIFDGTPAELETIVEPDAAGWGALPGTWKDRAIRARDAGEVHGDIYTDGTWYWVVQNGVAIIYNNDDCALVDPNTSGDVQVPSEVTDQDTQETFTVAALGRRALYGCKFVSAVTLPETIESIGEEAFSGTRISTLNIPAFVDTIYGNPAAGCARFTGFTVDEGNIDFFADANGLLFDYFGEELIGIPARATSVVIPESVVYICDDAFNSCKILTNATYLGNAPAFDSDDIYEDTSATKFTMYVAAGTTGWDGTSTTNMPASGLWPTASATGRQIVSLYKPDDEGETQPEDILSETVNGLTWYYRVVDGVAEIWRDGTTAVVSDSPISTITLPATLGGYQVKGLGDGALSNLRGITTITTPNTYEWIGDGVFSNCTSLASATLSFGLRSIGRHPFDGTAIETIEIPDTVSFIDGNIFYGCNPSVSLAVGDNNPYFAESEEGALYSRDFSTLFACPMLTESITIPAATTNIASEAFAGCLLLKSAFFEGDAPEAADEDDLYIDCHVSFTNFVQYGIESFGAVPGAWHLRPVLRYGEEPPEESEILTSADGKWRYRLLDDETAEIWNAGKCAYLGESPVGSLQVPSTLDGYVVSAIGDGALANFAAVTSVSIPFSVTAIGEDVFTNCTLLAGFSVDSSNLRFSTDGSTLFDYQKTEIIAVGRNIENFSAPATVSKIRAHAFDGCSLLASATFGDGIDEIGEGAFRGCSALETVTFDGDAPTTAADDIYDGTPEELETVVEPDSEGWGTLPGTWKGRTIRARDAGEIHGDICTDGTWYWVVQNGVAIIYNNGDCALVNPMTSGAIQVPDSVTDSINGETYTVAGLGSHALYNCAFIEEVTLPNTLKSIGTEPFSGTLITTLQIPAYVESIDGNPGAGCTRMTGFTVDEGNIDFAADKNGLLYDYFGEVLIGVPARATSVVVPESVISIWADAFDSCKSLTKATYLCDAPTVGSDDIYEDTSATKFTMYVAAGTTGWDGTSTTNMPASGLWPTASETGRPIVSLYKPDDEGETPPEDILSETVNGLTWYYRVIDGVAEIWRNDETAVTTDNPPLMSVALPETLGGYVVKGLGDGALSNLRGITDISIPNTYEWIGDFAFSNCTSLASANLGEGVGEIGRWPFFGTKITELQIPDSVESIDGNPIAGASLARQVTVSDTQPYFSVVDGVLYDKDVTTMLACPATKTTITVPATMTSITDDALYGCNVTFIGEATDGNITWTYEIVDGNAIITDASGSSQTVTIPNTLGGAPVTKIETDALNALTNVSSYASLSAAYTARNGILYSANGTHLVRVPDTTTLPYVVVANASEKKVTVTTIPDASSDGGNVDRTTYTTNATVISKSCSTNSVDGDISIEALLANVVVIDDYAFAGCSVPTNTMTVTSKTVSGESYTGFTTDGRPYIKSVSVVSTVSSNYTTAISLPASVLKVCNNAFEGSNVTILGDVPTVEVGDYPYSIDIPTYSADAAINQAIELLPLKSPVPAIVGDADYLAYFKVAAAEKPGVPGTYTVTAELDESAIEFTKSQNDVGAAIADVASGATDEATISAKPGLWYAIASSSKLDGPFEIVDCRLATDDTVTLTMNRPSSESGYYRLIVDIAEITTCP